MTRSELTKKYSHVADTVPLNTKVGDCYTGGNLIMSKQIRELKEGVNKIFYFRVTRKTNEECDIQLVSDDAYLSPIKYI